MTICRHALLDSVRMLATRLEPTAVASETSSSLPPAVMFSGGIDSALVAAALVECGYRPDLYVLCEQHSEDLEPARRFAEHFELQLYELTVGPKKIAKELPELLRRSPSLFGVAATIIEDAISAAAQQQGHNALWAGTGADLLCAGGSHPQRFGGFTNPDFAAEFRRQQIATWHWRFCFPLPWHSLVESWALPLATLEMLVAARRIAPGLWWGRHGSIEHDKAPLRHLAQELGVPEEIAWRPKSPAQVSSGVFSSLTEIMYQQLEEQGIIDVHNQPNGEQSLLALRIWIAWQAEISGAQAHSTKAPAKPLDYQELQKLLNT